MPIDQQLLEILVCIQCRGPLVSVEGGRGVLCEKCQWKFPVRDDVPVLLLEEVLDMKAQAGAGAPARAAGQGAPPPQTPRATAGQAAGQVAQPSPRQAAGQVTQSTALARQPARFQVEAGPKKGMQFQIECGTCKAIGRAVGDAHKTSAFHVDVTLALDDNTRRLIQQYVTKQFSRKDAAPGTEFGFRRTGDIVLEDLSVSRLHAMIFYDDIGVGVLDLVSKNGTFVNGEEVESRLLRQGDRIEVGDSKIVYEG